jgi:hypothetical protein
MVGLRRPHGTLDLDPLSVFATGRYAIKADVPSERQCARSDHSKDGPIDDGRKLARTRNAIDVEDRSGLYPAGKRDLVLCLNIHAKRPVVDKEPMPACEADHADRTEMHWIFAPGFGWRQSAHGGRRGQRGESLLWPSGMRVCE